MLFPAYMLYLAISIAITVWVGRTLHKNGRLFLVENFKGNEPLADSVNHLLLVGFYLINLGFISLTLKATGIAPASLEAVTEFLSQKIGFIIIVLGVMHFFNMYVLLRFRNLDIFQPHSQNKTGLNTNTSSAVKA
jgi:hypothetical protein